MNCAKQLRTTIHSKDPEMDQFCLGLQMLGVLDMLRKYPEIMQPLFIQAGPRKKLDKVKGFCRLFEGVQQMAL